MLILFLLWKVNKISATGEITRQDSITLFVCFCFHYRLSLFPIKTQKETCIQRFLLSYITNAIADVLFLFVLGCFSVLVTFRTVLKKKTVWRGHISLTEWTLKCRNNTRIMTVWFSTDWLILSLFIRHPHLSCDRLTDAEQWPMTTAQTWDRKWFIIHIEFA